MASPSITPPVQPQIVLSYIALGVLSVVFLFLVAYAFTWVYGIIKYGGCKRTGLRMFLAIRRPFVKKQAQATFVQDVEATDPFQTPTDAGISPPGDGPEWAVKYKSYLESTSRPNCSTLSSPSPSSTCLTPSTPPDAYPRGLGILVKGLELPESASLSDEGTRPMAPMIVIQCDDEDPQVWDGNTDALAVEYPC